MKRDETLQFEKLRGPYADFAMHLIIRYGKMFSLNHNKTRQDNICKGVY